MWLLLAAVVDVETVAVTAVVDVTVGFLPSVFRIVSSASHRPTGRQQWHWQAATACGVNVDSPGVNVDSPGVNVDSRPGVNIDSPGVNVDAPGVKVDSPGVNVDARVQSGGQ